MVCVLEQESQANSKKNICLADKAKTLRLSQQTLTNILKRADALNKYEHLDKCILEIKNNAPRERIGYLTMTAALRQRGFNVCAKTVLKRMQYLNVTCPQPEAKEDKYKSYLKSAVKAKFNNVLDRRFNANETHATLCHDVTETKLIDNQRLYASPVIDCADHSYVSIGVCKSDCTALVADPLVRLKGKLKEGAIVHSDNGKQYHSERFAELAAELGFVISMTNIGCCVENGLAESKHNVLKQLSYDKKHRKTDEEQTAYIFAAALYDNERRPHVRSVYAIKPGEKYKDPVIDGPAEAKKLIDEGLIDSIGRKIPYAERTQQSTESTDNDCITLKNN